MLFRHICATFFLLFSASFAISAHANTTADQKTSDIAVESELKELFEPIPDSHIILNTETYGVAEGLSQSTVTSIVQDNDGYLWVGTLNGLNRFDGRNFKKYFLNTHPELQSSFIKKIVIIEETLFIATNKGVSTYNKNTDNFTPIINIKEDIWSIQKVGNSIAIGTNENIYILENKTYKIKKIHSNNIFKNVKKISKYDNGYLFTNYNGDTYYLNPKTEKTKKIISDTNNILTINNKTLIFSPLGVQTLINGKLKKTNRINFNGVTRYKNKIIGVTNGKLYYLSEDGNLSSFIGEISNSSTKLDYSRIISNDNSILIPSISSGFKIIRKHSNLIKTFDLKGSVWNINSTNNGMLITSDNNIINFITDDGNKKIDSGVMGYKTARVIDNDIFIGSHKGLIEKSLHTKKEKKILDLNISSLELSLDGHLLIATSENNILKYSTKTKSFNKILELSKSSSIFKMHEYSRNHIFIAEQEGLTLFSENKKTKLFNKDIVYSIASNDKLVFFGTSTSIYSFNIENHSITLIENIGKPVYSLAENNGIIVASSLKEVLVIDIINNIKYKINDKYGSQNEYNTQSATFWKDNFFLGGMDGVSIVNINTLLDIANNLDTSITLTSLFLFNVPLSLDNSVLTKVVDKTDKIKLKFTDYPFSIEFASLKMQAKSVEHYYQLKGLSEDWIKSEGINSATYTNLSPGHYTFNIYGVNPLTKERSRVKSLFIEITPPWWLSFEAKIAYAFLCLLIIALFIRSIIRRREIQKQINKSEERLKLSLWGSGDEIWDWDLETGKIYRSNVWGTLDFPVVGQRVNTVGQSSNIHPMDRNRVKQLLEDHLKNKTEHFEVSYRVKSKDKKWIWILDRAKVVERSHDNKPLRMTGTIKNINEFKQTEEQLTLFERAIENISEGMFILDHSFRFIQVNQACCDITQTNRNHFIGQRLKFKEYPDSFSHQVMHMLRNHGRWTNEVDSLRGDGTPFQMEMSIDAIFDERDQTNHYVAVFTDITYKKQQQLALRKLTTSDNLTGPTEPILFTSHH
ncbi:PAS domain-containing protein [Parashewanella spongiae]|uniref:PAS domain-containing protein n=1 Tax=Parashewanella spongiae TaxID=342950 RepID=UPI0010595823|nr:PAS domain-containing protein [Parashewanella spongiae]